MANNNIDLSVNTPIRRKNKNKKQQNTGKNVPLVFELSTHLTDDTTDDTIVKKEKTVLSINVEQPITIEKNKNKGKDSNKRLTIDYSGGKSHGIDGHGTSTGDGDKKQTLYINLGEPYPERPGTGDDNDASHIQIIIESLPIFIGGKIDVEIINPPTRQKIRDNQNNPIEIQLRYRLLTTNLHVEDVTCHWISSNPEVATVDDTGLLRMVDVGQTTIRLEVIYDRDPSKRGYAEFVLTAVKRGFTYTFNFQLS